jgi:hypothetical protein
MGFKENQTITKPIAGAFLFGASLAPGFERFPSKLSNEWCQLTPFSNSEVLPTEGSTVGISPFIMILGFCSMQDLN